MLECRGLCFGYETGKEPLLSDISFSIGKGELIALLGPNGAGKSTLLDCLCGLRRPWSGQVLLEGQDMAHLSRRAIAQRIAYVPQKASVPFDHTALDYVVFGRTARLGLFQLPTKEDYQAAQQVMERLDVLPLRDRPFGSLSGGEQQKVSIARALAQEPGLLILDEPTSALDRGNQVRVLRLIRELSEEGYALLFTTHDPDQCLLLDSQVCILFQGLLRQGTAGELLEEERLREIYGEDIGLPYVAEFGRRICLAKSL